MGYINVSNSPDLWTSTIQVSFVGTRDYDASFNDHTDIMQLPVGDIYSPAANNFGTTLTGLFPNTQYTVSVFSVNGAGNGMTDTRTVNTLNGELISLSVWCFDFEFQILSVNSHNYLPPISPLKY